MLIYITSVVGQRPKATSVVLKCKKDSEVLLLYAVEADSDA